MKLKVSIFFVLLLCTQLLWAQIPNENLRLWLRADSVEIVNDKVATWYDLSGNDFHLTQDNATYRPTYADSVLNNKPAVRFDGSNDFMLNNFGQIFSQPNTIFIVYKLSSGGNRIIFDGTVDARTLLQYYNLNLKLRSITDNVVQYPLVVPSKYMLSTLVLNSPTTQLFQNLPHSFPHS